MQGKDETESQNRLILCRKVIEEIKRFIIAKINLQNDCLKKLKDLEENIFFTEEVLTNDKEKIKLSNIVEIGKEILEDLMNEIKIHNRSGPAYLKDEFDKIKNYYLSFSTIKSSIVALEGTFSTSKNHSSAINDMHASQDIARTTNFIQSAITYGHNSQAIVVQPLIPPANHLPELWNVPQRNKFFTGRETLLKQMKECLNSKEMKHLVLTAYGLGGIGKTQLTLEYVWQNYKEYKGVCWFNAESREQLMASYMSLGHKLNLFTEAEKNIDSEEKGKLEEKSKRVKEWLENPSRAGWLLIYDSAVKQDDINNLLPVKEGKILITSRHIYWPQYQKIPVGLFTQKESLDYIKIIIGETKYQENDANELAKLLGYLPLALAQASAYIEQNSISIAEYIDLYEKKYSELLAENMLPKDEYQKAIAITWNVTLAQMQKESPDSVELLYYCSHLYHEQIPESLIPYFFKSKDKAELNLIVNKAKRIARQYSMITVDENKKSFSMHSLVQQVIRTQLTDRNDEIKYLINQMEALYRIFPNENTSQDAFELIKTLSTHLEKGIDYIDNYFEKITHLPQQSIVFQKEILLKILIELAECYGTLGSPLKRKKLAMRALSITELFKVDEKYRAIILHHIGNASGDLGNPREQIIILEQALKIFQRICLDGENWPAITMQNLSNAYGKLGNPHKQKILLEEALEILDKDREKNILERASVLNNLATACGALGDRKRKKDLLEEALDIYEKHDKEQNIRTAITIANLGVTCGELDDHQQKNRLLNNALNIIKKFPKEDLILLAETTENYAISFGDLGDLVKNRELLEEVLKIKEKHYGIYHVEYAKTLANLGNVFFKDNQLDSAKLCLDQALTIIKSHSDKNDIQIALIKGNLGVLHMKLGNYDEAEKLLFNTLLFNEEFYGKCNFQLIDVLVNLAILYNLRGKIIQKRITYERVLKIQEDHYGKEHIETAKTLSDLSVCYLQQENLNEAKRCMERAFNIFVKTSSYGINHHLTQNAKQILIEINSKLSLPQNLFKGIFCESEDSHEFDHLKKIIKKYNLSNSSQSELEKGLRMAVIKNQIEDIYIFIKEDINIDGQDSYTKKTALHRAVLNKDKGCIEILLAAGAKFDIKDALGKTVFDYAKETKDNEIISLFIIHKNKFIAMQR